MNARDIQLLTRFSRAQCRHDRFVDALFVLISLVVGTVGLALMRLGV